METKTYTTVDRTNWPSGEWDNEPDKVQWQDEKTGLPCLAVRNPKFGNWCGYVGVVPGHPLYGKHYREAEELNVHGGLTFADKCCPAATEATGICHVPGPGESNEVWWIGFDCAHGWDYMPGFMSLMKSIPSGLDELTGLFLERNATYRTLKYVQEQCLELAAQLMSERYVNAATITVTVGRLLCRQFRDRLYEQKFRGLNINWRESFGLLESRFIIVGHLMEVIKVTSELENWKRRLSDADH